MYAIIRAGGKQAKVREGDVLDVERIKSGESSVTYRPLLLVHDDGTVISDRAALDDASVTAEIVGDHRGPKVEIFKYKAKTGYRRRQGHRQTYTTIKITGIDVPGASKPAEKSTKKSPVDNGSVAAETESEQVAAPEATPEEEEA